MSHVRLRHLARVRSCCARAALATLALASALFAPGAAAAWERMETIDVPSTRGNVVPWLSPLNEGATALRARVLLPNGYAAQADRRWPVLYLLHGADDNMTAWTDKGGARQVLDGLEAIVVMPEGGKGYFTDWWRWGLRVGSNWERYYLDEVVPQIEGRYRIQAGRQHHAIGGLSMGGYGAVLLASQLPSYFGNVLTLSGLLNPQSIDSLTLLNLQVQSNATIVWGPPLLDYANVHTPVQLGAQLAGSRIYVYSGNGLPDLRYGFDLLGWTLGAGAEVSARLQANEFAGTMRRAGASVREVRRTGVHAWGNWRAELGAYRQFDPFGAPPITQTSQARTWTYRTMAPTGNAWGIGYRFSNAPPVAMTLRRSGQQLSGSGFGTLTISGAARDADASGVGTRADCVFDVSLPFQLSLPAGC